MPPLAVPVTKECEYLSCQKRFSSRSQHRRFCSRYCQQRNARELRIALFMKLYGLNDNDYYKRTRKRCPKKSHRRGIGRINATFTLSPEMKRRMVRYKSTLNWSAVICDAIELKLTQLENT